MRRPKPNAPYRFNPHITNGQYNLLQHHHRFSYHVLDKRRGQWVKLNSGRTYTLGQADRVLRSILDYDSLREFIIVPVDRDAIAIKEYLSEATNTNHPQQMTFNFQ